MTAHFFYGVHSLTMDGPFDSFEEANANNPRQIVRFETTLAGFLGNPIFITEVSKHLWFMEKYNYNAYIEKFVNRLDLRQHVVHNVFVLQIHQAETDQALTQDMNKWICDLYGDSIISYDKYMELKLKIFPHYMPDGV